MGGRKQKTMAKRSYREGSKGMREKLKCRKWQKEASKTTLKERKGGRGKAGRYEGM